MSEENFIPKYTPIIVIDGKTVGIKEFQVISSYNSDRPYVRFETTSGYTFELTPSDAQQVIERIERQLVVYIKRCNGCSKWMSKLGIFDGLEEYIEK